MPALQVAFFRFNFYNIMKLHLPTRLRAAVLACFAVVTSFTTTLATGVLAGGAFAVAIAGSQALAAYDEPTATITGTASAGAGGISMGSLTVPAGQTLTFAINQDTGQTYFNGTQTYAGDIVIKNTAGAGEDATGMVISDGNGSNIITFSGNVTGGGVMYKTGNGEKNTWIFTGDVSQFTGDIKLNSNAINFKIKFGTTNNSTETQGVSGTGDLTFESDDNSLAYEYSGGSTVYVTNVISATGSNTSRVALIGTDEVVFTKNVTIHELRGVIYTGNNATLPTGSANASKITFKGASSTLGKSGKTNAITSTLEVAEGAGLTLAGTMSFASLGDTPRVTGSGSVTIADGFVMELGADFTPELNKEYKLFADTLHALEGWDTLSQSNFRQNDDVVNPRSEIVLTDYGFKFAQVGSVYSDMSTSGEGNWNYTDAIWNTAQDDSDAPIAFTDDDSAVFSANADLTLTETEVAAAAVTVNQGAELTLTGNGNRLNCANIVLAGDLVLKDNVLASSSRVSGNGALYIAGEVMFDENQRYAAYTGDVIVLNGGILKVGTGVGNNAGVLGADFRTSGSTRTITVNSGGIIDINGKADFYYHVVLKEGAFYKNNTSTNVTSSSRQLPKLELLGDATVHAVGTLGMMGSSGTSTTLILNGNTLSKTGNGEFFLNNTSVGSGTLDVQTGLLTVMGNGTYTDTHFEIANGATLSISGGTFSNATITVRSGNTANSTNATLGATVTVGNGSTFQANGGTYTDTAIVLEDGATFNYRTGGNHTFKSFNTGASTLSAADDSSRTMTVTEASTSTGLLTKNNAGHLVYNGAADLRGGLNITGGSVRFNSNASIGGPVTMSDGTALHVGGEADVVISGTGHGIKGLNILAGAGVTFASGSSATLTNTTLAAPIVNKGNVTLSGTLTVSDLSGFTPTAPDDGSLTYVDAEGNAAENGYLSGERAYTLIDNTGTLNDDAITAVSGVAGTYADGVLTSTSTDESVFYVNTTVDSVALGEGKKYYINGGTLNVTTDAYNILSTAEGTTGTIKITETGMATGNTNLTIAFEGKLELASGIVFTLGKAEVGGGGDGKVIDVDSFSSVILNNGSTLNYHGNGNTTIKNFTVKEGTANLYYIDANDANAVQMVGVTTLNGHLNFTTQYDGAVAFERLTGVGNLTSVAASGASEDFRLSVQSLQGYKGAISLTKGGSTYEATISTGSTEAVSFKGISVTNAMTLNLNVEAATTMTEGLSLSNGATVSATAATGGSLSTALVVNENREENSRSNSVFRYTGSDLSIRDITLNNTARLEADFDADSLSIKVGNDTRLKAANNRTLTVTSLSAVAGSDNSSLTIGGNGKVYLNGSGSIESLGIGAWGSSPVVDLNGTYTVGRLRMSEEGTSGLNLNAGSTLNVTGTINDNSTSRSLLLAHWGYASTLVQDGGTLNATGAVMYTGWTGAGTYQAKSGTATLKGISFRAQDWGGNNYRGAFLLGDESGGSARVNIGSEGIYGINNGASGAEVTVKLGNGTLGAYADWTMGYDAGRTAIDVQLIGANGGTIIDTADITDSNVGHTITINSSLVGSGKLVKTGAGTLKLAAANTYSGGTSLNGGTLEVAAEAALGSGALSVTGGILDVTGNVTLGSIVSTTVSGGSLKASHADGWTLTSASVGGAAVSTDSVGKVTMTNTTVTGDITGNDKLVLAGTVNATANATVSGAGVGGITVTTTDANKLTLNNTTIGSTITNNGALEFSGTQNVTLAGSSTTMYADVYGSTTYGDNGYKRTQSEYTLVSGTAVTAVADTSWQVNGVALSGTPTFDGKVLTHITGDAAGKVYYINSGTVVYETGAGCTEAEKLQLNGGKLELKTELAANKLSMGTGAAAVLMGDGTLNMGTGTALASGISLGTETDAKWVGTVKVVGAALSDANLGALGISGSTIELDDTDGTLKGGTYAAAVKLTNGSELTLGVDNAFNGGLDATNGSVKITGKNSISTLTLADAATLGIDFTGMGLDTLLDMGDEALLTVGTLNAGTAGGALNLSALVSKDLLLTMSNGQSITLADITTNNATVSLLLDDGSSTPAGSLEVTDDNGYLYIYTLAQDDATGHTVVKVSAKLYQSGWKGDENDVWTNTDSIGGLDDNWEDTVGLFAGYGSGTVNIDTAGVDASAQTVMVSATEHTTDYTFEGGTLVADRLAVNAGSLTISSEGVDIVRTVQVSDTARLAVSGGSELTVGTDMAILDEAVFTNRGTTTVIGTLIVAKNASLTNNRSLTVGRISAEEGTIHSIGRLIIGNGGGVVGALTGNGYLDNSGKLTIQSDVALEGITNTGELVVDGTLKAVTISGTGIVNAAAAELGNATVAGLYVDGAVKADNLTADNATMDSLVADKLVSLAGGTVEVTRDATLKTLMVNGHLTVGGKLTATETVNTEGEVTAAEAELTTATFDTLKVTGSVEADNLTVKQLETASLSASTLTVDGGVASIGSSVTLDSFTGLGKAKTLIQGDFAVNSTVVKGGSIEADKITVKGNAAFTDVKADALTADAVALTTGSISQLNTNVLTVNKGGLVSVKNEVKLNSLSGEGTLQVSNKLTLAEQITCSANVEAQEIELLAMSNSLDSVLADTLTLGGGVTLSTTEAVLKTNSFGALSNAGVSVVMSDTVVDSLLREESGRFSTVDYLIIDGVGTTSSFNLVDGTEWQALHLAGMNAALTVNKGGLYLSITAVTDENGDELKLTWDASDGNNTTSMESDINTGAGFYKALDYVQKVTLADERIFDLAAGDVGDAVGGNASDPEAGLLVRNLSGGGELTIRGNGAGQDVASIFNTNGTVVSAADAVGLTVDASTVNLGLPQDSTGKLVEDYSSTGPTLASLALINGARVEVQTDAEVLGDTDLADGTRLTVQAGSLLTTGMLSGTEDTVVSGAIRVSEGGVYTGSYEGADITAAGGSRLRLRLAGRSGLGLAAESGSDVTLDYASQGGSMDSLRVGEAAAMARMARMAAAGTTELNLLNTTVTDSGISHNTLTLAEQEGNHICKAAVTLSLGVAETARTLGTQGVPVVIDGAVDVTDSSITVTMLGSAAADGVLDISSDALTGLTLAQLVTGGQVEGNTVVLTGTPEVEALMAKYYSNARLNGNGAIVVDRTTDYYSSHLSLSGNGSAGAALADAVLVKLNPQADREEYRDMAAVLDSLDAAVMAGNSASADRLGAAVSGASVAAMGAAVAGDLERQLLAIRNRTTTMGVDQSKPNLDMPYFNAWINAEGDFRRMDEDGTAAGYELNSWGGTVGFDADVSPNLTMGLAATAMYGDFTAKSAEHAEGDLDTYYVTGFARYSAHRWSHTFVATLGMADASLKRTVTHARGSYSAEGETDAFSFGFLYEAGYVAAMNESATACLQPVFNVMLTHSALSGYDEEGSDAALAMGDVDMTTVTFGLGARVQAQVGTSLINHSSILEGRALLKLRAGDREAEASNALRALPGVTGSVTGAEMGVVGVELGVGLTVPVGSESSSIFADASLEVGGGYTNINGTVGYRINF